MKESKFLQLIEKQLSDEPFSKDGTLQKWVVIGKAQNGDQELLKCLLASAELKTAFFKPIDTADGALVFEHQKFIRYLEMKNFLKDSYTEYQNKIGLHTDGQYLKPSGDVVLAWPFKDCVLEGGQTREETKRDEVLFNQILARDEITQFLSPKVLTAAARHTAKNAKGKPAKVQFNRDSETNKKRNLPADTITDNLLIKGNNLLTLHSLKKQFGGKVKLIYIDPPYNTGNDSFNYNDNFSHSSWLTFMKNRLEVARELLREDGVIFVQCDDNEQAYLKVLMDNIFGRDNFVNNIIWKTKNRPQNDAKYLSANADFIILFSKNKSLWKPNLLERTEKMDAAYKNPDNDLKGPWASMPIHAKSGRESSVYEITFPNGVIWQPPIGTYPVFSKDRLLSLYSENILIFKGNNVRRKTYLSDVQQGRVPITLWDDLSSTIKAASEIQLLFKQKLFKTPKPENLIQRIMELATKPGDIVLDYHLGSGTTAAVAHKMQRQYIGVEQMDYIDAVALERLKKVISGEQGGISKAVDWQGGGEFVYLELKQHNQKFVEAIQTATTSRMLLNIWEKMKKEAFLDYNLDLKKQEESLAEFKKLTLKQQKKSLLEILDKNQMYVNLPSLHDTDHRCSGDEKRITVDFYGIKK